MKLGPKIAGEVKGAMRTFGEMTSRELMISEDSMLRLIKGFLLYRPDFGYSQVNLSISWIEHVLRCSHVFIVLC